MALEPEGLPCPALPGLPPPLAAPPSTQAQLQKSKGVKSPKLQSKSSLMPSPSSSPK